MLKDKLVEHVAFSESELSNNVDERDIRNSLKNKGLNLYDIDKVIFTAKNNVFKRISVKAQPLLETKLTNSTLDEFVTDESVPEGLREEVRNRILAQHREARRNKVLLTQSRMGNPTYVINELSDEIVTKEMIRDWIISHYELNRKGLKMNRNKTLLTGIGLVLLGVIITGATYMFFSAAGGTKFFFTYGLIVAGFISIGKGFSIKLPEVPVINI